MKIDALVFEIGSTTTLVNAFDHLDGDAIYLGNAQYRTTVKEGDVTIGLERALSALKEKFKVQEIVAKSIFATSSAAGGLKMCVHGLVYDMTAKAAKEAALGAGANIKMITSGKLRRSDLKKLSEIQPNIILIAGGVDYGERETALFNAEEILKLNLDIPVIYAGNIENQEEIRLLFEEYQKEDLLMVVENVYPAIDQLNIEPTRQAIQEVFEKHITSAKGMEKIRKIVTHHIIPTPGAVMEATKLLSNELKDVLCIDIGGATTDVHSVTDGTEFINRILLAPEPKAKRTVEGDLGLYVSRENLIKLYEREELAQIANLSLDELDKILDDFPPIPTTEQETRLLCVLSESALKISLRRHAGQLIDLYYSTGKKQAAKGKDLTGVERVIATGGALTRLPCAKNLLEQIPTYNPGNLLLPQCVHVLIDQDYVMASLGVLSKQYPHAALTLLRNSLSSGEEYD